VTILKVAVWAISLIFGAICVVSILIALDTTLAKFSPVNAVLVFLSMGAFAFIWLDYVFRTDYLRE
jgi:hypothetical protein